ncbi:MAG: hypothetical protein AABZ55_04975 [Bdellovibrionota bacterium]
MSNRLGLSAAILILTLSSLTWAKEKPKSAVQLRDDRVEENAANARAMVIHACNSLKDSVSVTNCMGRANSFLKYHKKVPCRSVFSKLYRYNLMKYTCRTIAVNEEKLSGKGRMNGIDELHSLCMFAAYETGFAPKMNELRESDKALIRLGQATGGTSPDYQSKYPCIIKDPCQCQPSQQDNIYTNFNFGSKGYKKCFEAALDKWVEKSSTDSRDFSKQIEEKRSLKIADPEYFCGADEKEVTKDQIAAIASLSDPAPPIESTSSTDSTVESAQEVPQ